MKHVLGNIGLQTRFKVRNLLSHGKTKSDITAQVSIIAHLWGVQKGETAIGSATTGSSEAIHLGGLAMKRRWQEKRDAEGKDKTKPNIIMGSNAQVALEKFARYFEVEARILDVTEKSKYRLDPELVKKNIDENTIGVFVSKLSSPSYNSPFHV